MVQGTFLNSGLLEAREGGLLEEEDAVAPSFRGLYKGPVVWERGVV